MTQEQLKQELIGQPVRSLQYMLGRLARVHPVLPALAADGIFGERTLEAVMIFQREFHPPVTGIVDRDTFRAIYNAWTQVEKLLGDSRPLRVFPSEGYRAMIGADEVFLILPQTMFQILGRYFSGILPGPADGLHTGASVSNVQWLQRAGGLKPSGILDMRSWDLLCRLYEVMVVWSPAHAEKMKFTGGRG